MSLRETFRLIRSDYVRMASHYGFRLTPGRAIGMTILPALMALILHRLAHYCITSRVKALAWPLYSLNVMITGADIVPRTTIGPGCLLGHATGMIISGRIGRNATLLARCGIGGGKQLEDIGAGRGLPILGDNVTVCANASVMGAIRIGDNATIGAYALALKDVPAGGLLVGVPGRLIRTKCEPMFGSGDCAPRPASVSVGPLSPAGGVPLSLAERD